MKTWSKRSFSPLLAESSAEALPGGLSSAAGLGPIDAHVHVFPAEMIARREAYLERDARFKALYGAPKAAMVTAGQTVESMDENGVAMSVVVGFSFADQGLCRLVNDCILDAVKKYPERLVGLACVAADAPGAKIELERCLDGGLRGCGELVLHGGSWGEKGSGAGGGLSVVADCLRERGLPLLVHASEPVGHQYPGKGGFFPADCVALAEAYPGLKIVFAHMGGGLFLYEAMPEVRRTLADVFYDTAAVPYLYGPEIYDACVSTAGPEKLLFGSDYPLLAPARYSEGLARLDPAVRVAVQGGNARKVYRL